MEDSYGFNNKLDAMVNYKNTGNFFNLERKNKNGLFVIH